MNQVFPKLQKMQTASIHQNDLSTVWIAGGDWEISAHFFPPSSG